LEVVRQFNPKLEPYFIIRLVSLRAYHDVGINGLTDKLVMELIGLLEKYGMVFITSERPLPGNLEKYRLNIEPYKIAMYYSMQSCLSVTAKQ